MNLESIDHNFTLIHWCGPFTLDEVITSEWGNKEGLYIATGKIKRSRADSSIQYCGISESEDGIISYATYFQERAVLHKISPINRELQIWLGDVIISRLNFDKFIDPERLIILYLGSKLKLLNSKNSFSNHPQYGTIVNYWFNKDGTLRTRKSREMRDLPDVISWDGKVFRFSNLSITNYEFENPSQNLDIVAEFENLRKNLDIVAEFEEYAKDDNNQREKPSPCWVKFNYKTKELSVKFEYEQGDGKPNTYVTFSGVQNPSNPVEFHLTSEKPDVDNSTMFLKAEFDGELWYFNGCFNQHYDTGEIERREIYINQI